MYNLISYMKKIILNRLNKDNYKINNTIPEKIKLMKINAIISKEKFCDTYFKVNRSNNFYDDIDIFNDSELSIYKFI